MKVVINKCFGGFGLSAIATQEIAKRKGVECYFFKHGLAGMTYEPLSVEQAEKELLFYTYSVANPEDYRLNERDKDGTYKSANKRAEKIGINYNRLDRHDKDLIEVVEKLGKLANTKYSKLEIIDIPDGTDYEIMEYDGLEHIAEKHKTWG